ncbi:hypothetical protein B0A54_01424 [Friedmanniomyces endolithicus]|uniref:Uncharacterized protein n=1 Tax=Friedmanniomyces endolithicus TaxID=329885 RepID=A0A4U0VFX3_9PEZI|nr:hypothetical protein LTS09_014637 [Friedmanniomyces endolithicus]TKA47934.1 hypothetical protein B0A54_01424 [Friedmanniomyces endolithicus]
MQRRSTTRAIPRKNYTVDAFQGVQELEAAIDPDHLDEDGKAELVADDDEVDLMDVESEPSDDESEPMDLVSDTQKEQRPKTPRSAKTRKKRPRQEQPGRLETAVNEATRRWMHVLTLPTRNEDQDGYGGFRHNSSQGNGASEDVARAGWSWYLSDGGKQAFQTHQRLDVLTAEEAKGYLGDQQAVSFVMGPYQDQKLFHLTSGQSMPLANAWEISAGEIGSTDTPEVALHYKPGFMLNLGAEVLCLGWIPRRDSKVQYLTTLVSPEQTGVDLSDPPSSPDSRLTKQSHICIWRFEADAEGYIDTTITPTLALVLCTDWGEISTFQWCPTACPAAVSLGLLAFIAEDGALRVLEVPVPSADDGAAYVLVKQAAFEWQPPNMICTCITWSSPTLISAGCAKGSVYVCDLENISSTNDPGLSFTTSKNCIEAIISCAPSHPHILFVTSAVGGMTVADINQVPPKVSPLNATQVHDLSQPLLLWHDHLQRALTTDDDCEVVARSLQKGKHRIIVSQARNAITAIAAGASHPCILVATEAGDVFATNPLIQAASGKADMWQQTWFSHQWRRPTVTDRESAEQHTLESNGQPDKASITTGKNGLSRILEGFKPERIPPEARGKAFPAAETGAHAVHEEQSAVTSLAWNPNINCGGWAAAGMADGLVRVEDIAV